MSQARSAATAALKKTNEALLRAVPCSRMRDYGVHAEDVAAWMAALAESPARPWHQIGESLAEARRELALAAQAQGKTNAARAEWLACAALLQCAQLAFHHDESRKHDLYEAAWEAFRQGLTLLPTAQELSISVPGRFLHGWAVLPHEFRARAAVVLVGGLSGWGPVYFSMAQALAARGVMAILAEGPGQGLPRLRHGLTLSAARMALFGRFLDVAQELGARRLGVWGNSFGGLFAAHMAVSDARVLAVCINGAPMRPEVPEFRTAREQMAALTGCHRPRDLAAAIAALTLCPDRHSTDAAMLVLEGGSDPLVPVGSQAEFFKLTSNVVQDLFHWEDGEHTIYNHAAERNARAADWFAQQLQVVEA